MILVQREIPSEIDSAIYGTVGATLLALIIKFADRFFDRQKTYLDEHLALRKELREELDAVKSELSEMQKALDEWKEKYYHQVEITNTLKLDMVRLTEELNDYKEIVSRNHLI